MGGDRDARCRDTYPRRGVRGGLCRIRSQTLTDLTIAIGLMNTYNRLASASGSSARGRSVRGQHHVHAAALLLVIPDSLPAQPVALRHLDERVVGVGPVADVVVAARSTASQLAPTVCARPME